MAGVKGMQWSHESRSTAHKIGSIVYEPEWQKLQEYAKQEGVSISRAVTVIIESFFQIEGIKLLHKR